MEMIMLRNVQPTDLQQLLAIENEGFSPKEAATKEAFIERIKLIADTFIVAEKEGEILGYINGPIIQQPYITDDLFEEIKENPKLGGWQSILGLAVSKQARNQGISKRLMKRIEELVKENKRLGVTLTCKEELISFYEACGYANQGVAESIHGGVVWYNMVKTKEKC